jgi:hypothetical protein
MARVVFRRFHDGGNEYLTIEGPKETIDQLFLLLPTDGPEGWAPWIWNNDKANKEGTN